MKQKQRCGECKREYFTTMIRVIVFKKHTCPEDKTDLIISSSDEIFTCPKCNKVYHKSVPREYNSLGTRIEGSSRDFVKANKMRENNPTIEFDNVFVPEQVLCQKCRNMQNRYTQATQKREKKIAMGISDSVHAFPKEITNADIYKREIFEKTKADFQETRKQEYIKTQNEERAKAEAENKTRLAKQLHEGILPKPEEMKSLIDPETAKLIEEVKQKDARIAELKKKIEEAKNQ